MNRYSLLFSVLIYFLSCTSNDGNWVSKNNLSTAVSIHHGTIQKEQLDKIAAFSSFLQEMAKEPMIASGKEGLQQMAQLYFPDSTVAENADLHAREIGNLDTFRLVYYEYFDLEAAEDQSYLGIFSPSGEALDVHPLEDVSFEGNLNINLIDEQLIEISYYDFFKKQQFGKTGLIPTENFYLQRFKRKKDIFEGYLYEYYRIATNGQLQPISENTVVSLKRKYPQSSARLLSFSELEHLSYDAILRMKNEIFADHGYIFSDKVTQKQFKKEKWYKARYDNINTFLTEIERINLAKLQKLERQY